MKLHNAVSYSIMIALGVLTFGCFLRTDRFESETIRPSYILSGYPNSALVYADSLEVEAVLNDSVFLADDILLPDLPEYSCYSSPFSTLEHHHPRVRFTIHNRCSSDLLVWWNDISIARYGPHSSAAVYLQLGSIDTVFGVYHVCSEGRGWESVAPFEKVVAGGSLVFGDSVDLVGQFGIFGKCMFEPGKYWARLAYSNRFVWQDTLPPVWIGLVWSDTLWFRIVE